MLGVSLHKGKGFMMGLELKSLKKVVYFLCAIAAVVFSLTACSDDSSSGSTEWIDYSDDEADSLYVERDSTGKALDEKSDKGSEGKKGSAKDDKASVSGKDSIHVELDTAKAREIRELDSLQKALEDSVERENLQNLIPFQADTFSFAGIVEAPLFTGKSVNIANLTYTKDSLKLSLSFDAALDKNGAFSVKDQQLATMPKPYVRVSVFPVYGQVPIVAGMSALFDVSKRDFIALNMFYNLVSARIEFLMENAESPKGFDEAEKMAVTEVWKAFHVDASSFDTSLVYAFNGKESGAAALALHELVDMWIRYGCDPANGNYQVLRLDSLVDDLSDNGTWDDALSRTAVADMALRLDVADGFAELRKEAFSVGTGAVPDFEKYMRNFYQKELGLEPCGEKNAGKTYFVTNGNSAFYASDMDDVSVSKERFACKADGGIEFASDSLMDLSDLEDAGEDGEVRVGTFSGNLYYTYDESLGAWRASTALEKDSYFVQLSATDKFVDIQDVYEGLKSNERVIFVLRHAERTDDTSKGGSLTSNGKSQSENVGKKLLKFAEPFRLGASEFLRAHQTVEHIAIGRGQNSDVRDTLPELNDDWYIMDKSAKDKAESDAGGGWEATSKYAYTGAYTTGASPAYYNLEERSVELIEDVLMKKYNNPEERYVVLSSHDKLMVPLVVYCTNFQVNLKKYEGGHWINYLAGVAIIIDELGNRRYVPVKGLSSEYMN